MSWRRKRRSCCSRTTSWKRTRRSCCSRTTMRSSTRNWNWMMRRSLMTKSYSSCWKRRKRRRSC